MLAITKLLRNISLLVVFLMSKPAYANLITNGDFNAGLSAWTTFTTGNGTIGSPTTTLFDVDGDSVSTSAAQFLVGQVTFDRS